MWVMRLPWPWFVVRMRDEGDGVALGVGVEWVVGRREEVGCGTAISGAYIWGMVSWGAGVDRRVSAESIACLLLEVDRGERLGNEECSGISTLSVTLRLYPAKSKYYASTNINVRAQHQDSFRAKICQH